MFRLDSLKGSLPLAALLVAKLASAQAVPWLDNPTVQSTPAPSPSQGEPRLLGTMAPQVATTTVPSTVTIPAGTRVMMVLKSPLHTTSGTAGSGIYLETLFPVVQGNGVIIPARTQVQGVVEADERPGHLKRTSEFRFRFTTMILPNNVVVPINGALQSIPGAKNIRTHDKNGTLMPVDQTEKVVTPAAASTVGGAIIGSHRSFGIGGFLPGAGLGAALGLSSVLLKRGDEINLVRGTSVEMVLVAPVSLQQTQVWQNAHYAPESLAPDGTPQNSENSSVVKRKKRPSNSFGTINPFRILVPFD